MESLYHQTNSLLEQTQGYFIRLEQGARGEDSAQLQTEIQGRLDTMWSNTERLDMMAAKEPVQRRQAARQRVEQLKYDVQHLHAALQSLASRAREREREATDREMLLSTQFTTNDARKEGGSETSIMIDRALEHQAGLGRSSRYLDDMLGQGASILENLREQRGTLKGAQKRILDVANTLGMSNTVIRLIERRAEGDKYILWGGMLATCVFMYLVIRWFT